MSGHSISTLSLCTNGTRLPNSARLATKKRVEEASRMKEGFGCGGRRVDVKRGGVRESILTLVLPVQ